MRQGLFHLHKQATAKQQQILEDHFQTDDPARWKKFNANLRSPGFIKAVKEDPRSDNKLKRFVERRSEHLKSKDPGIVVKGKKTYKVKFHPEKGHYSCSCPDWTFRHAPATKVGDCKHIQSVKKEKELEKKAGSGVFRNAILGILRSNAQAQNKEKGEREGFVAGEGAKSYKKLLGLPKLSL